MKEEKKVEQESLEDLTARLRGHIAVAYMHRGDANYPRVSDGATGSLDGYVIMSPGVMERLLKEMEEVNRLKSMVVDRERLAEKYCGMLDQMVKVQEDNPGPDRAELAPQSQAEQEKHPGYVRAGGCSCGTPDDARFDHGWTGCRPRVFKQEYRGEFPKRCECGDPHNTAVDHDELGCTWKKLGKKE